MSKFQKATKSKSRLRMSIVGPSGSGKTYSALKIASAMGGRTAVIDTERGSASKYADQFEFDVLELTSFAPSLYVEAIRDAEAAGYDNLVIDSLTHAWAGKDGALEMKDKATKRTGNSYTAWADVTPEQNRLVDAILGTKCNVFVTMRSKTEYVLEENAKGKTVPRKVGMAPIQRDGIEYEFDIVGDLTLDHDMFITKTRCSALEGKCFSKPGDEFAAVVKAWLSDGVDAPAPTPAEAAKAFFDGLDSGLFCNEQELTEIMTLAHVAGIVTIDEETGESMYPRIFAKYAITSLDKLPANKFKEVRDGLKAMIAKQAKEV